MGYWGEQLIEQITNARSGGRWPPDELAQTWREVAKWIAFRESDREYLGALANAQTDRQYMVDPLAENISAAFASLIFGDEPTVTAAAESDQERLDELCKGLGAACQRGVLVSSSEGELWWRIHVDRSAADTPLIDWRSSAKVIPLWIGSKLMAVAFYATLYDPSDTTSWIYRLFEVHEQGEVTNWLFAGTDRTIGQRRELAAHPETSELQDSWVHELDMLAGWIPNRLGADARRGVSDYRGIEDFLLSLNECATIGNENLRLVAQQRMVVPDSAVDQYGNLPANNVLTTEAVDSQLGGGTSGVSPFKVLEYSFDAQALIAWQNQVTTLALSRVGINAQFVGAPSIEGLAQSGTALRVRLIPSINAGNDRAQFYDAALPHMLGLAQQVDAMSVEQGGFGTPWSQPEEPPAIDRPPPLPEDPVEQAVRLATLRDSELMSIEQGVRERKPEWSDEQVAEEVTRIGGDASRTAAPSPFAGLTGTLAPPRTAQRGARREQEQEPEEIPAA